MRAASVNPLDWHFMRGTPYVVRAAAVLSRPKAKGLGADMAGQVEAVGKDATEFRPGDEVFGSRSGTFAEYVSIRNTEWCWQSRPTEAWPGCGSWPSTAPSPRPSPKPCAPDLARRRPADPQRPAPPPENLRHLALGTSDRDRLGTDRRPARRPMTSTKPPRRSRKEPGARGTPGHPARQPGHRHTRALISRSTTPPAREPSDQSA